MSAREDIIKSVEEHIDDYMQIVETLYHHPEIGNEEFESMALLVDYLTQAGFETQAAYILPTAFLATYDTHKAGPTFAFMCEYDALPEVGHGCGHNLIAAIGVAAGVALKSVMDEFGGKVLVVGTPAEENFGGKVSLADAGVFDNVDVALMVHPDTRNGVGSRSNALYPLKFEFFGKNAHACRPAEGASALDAAVMSYLQINLLRQFVAPHTYIHGVISDGGKAANVIPGYAAMEYYFRAPTIAYAKEVAAKAVKMVEGVCAANGTTFETSVYECPYDDTVINYRLAELLKAQYQSIGVMDVESVDEIATGSTDVGAVSYKCPTIQGFIKIADKQVQAHTKEMAAATLSDAGKLGLIKAAQGIALTALQLIQEPETLAQVKAEQNETLAKLAHNTQ
ncbi:amidohydrolase [Aerococcaceae bacterium zg-BR9]|uniref:amidohydrolase n=1 Tax=Aerococcaceae bacterium zg-1292 TaxID=2774330 RepID=UPI00406323C5|nr:amidohydrolase [Aerococcaceae bacterium zg-BR9]MBF6977884.1 amidohydrolase [Aerococcaceae bacterium zg-BR22]